MTSSPSSVTSSSGSAKTVVDYDKSKKLMSDKPFKLTEQAYTQRFKGADGRKTNKKGGKCKKKTRTSPKAEAEVAASSSGKTLTTTCKMVGKTNKKRKDLIAKAEGTVYVTTESKPGVKSAVKLTRKYEKTTLAGYSDKFAFNDYLQMKPSQLDAALRLQATNNIYSAAFYKGKRSCKKAMSVAATKELAKKAGNMAVAKWRASDKNYIFKGKKAKAAA